MNNSQLTTPIFKIGFEESSPNDLQADKQRLQVGIANYFVGLQMVKLKQHALFGLWYAKYSGLTMDEKFVVCVVHKCQQSIGDIQQLRDLNWISFQTRTFIKPPATGFQEQICESIITPIMNTKIRRQKFDSVQSVFECTDLPISVVLLHVKDCNDDGCTIVAMDEYPEQGTILSAILTYRCEIRFIL